MKTFTQKNLKFTVRITKYCECTILVLEVKTCNCNREPLDGTVLSVSEDSSRVSVFFPFFFPPSEKKWPEENDVIATEQVVQWHLFIHIIIYFQLACGDLSSARMIRSGFRQLHSHAETTRWQRCNWWGSLQRKTVTIVSWEPVLSRQRGNTGTSTFHNCTPVSLQVHSFCEWSPPSYFTEYSNLFYTSYVTVDGPAVTTCGERVS